MQPRIRFGMVGGGPDANIGPVHRYAARLDNEYTLVCGVFSRDYNKTLQTGTELGLNPARIYRNHQEMFEMESQLPADERMQVVSIVTPNTLHFPIAKMALEHGFHVICEKPMTNTLAEAKQLQALVENTNKLICITYTKAGYPMVKEARAIVQSGRLGNIRKVYSEYPQGGFVTPEDLVANKQAIWRNDISQSGISGTLGDVGTHAFHLAEYITNLKIIELAADVNTIVPTRVLDDDCAALIKFENGASGILIATQIAVGEFVNPSIRVYGDKGALEWHHAEPDLLRLHWHGKPTEILRAGYDNSQFHEITLHNGRKPSGFFEGHLEAFANHYRNFAITIRAHDKGEKAPAHIEFPTVYDGKRGIAFVETMLASAQSPQKWLRLLD